MATLRQKLAFNKTIENQGNVSKAMKEAGYSRSHAHNPQSLVKSKGFQQMLQNYIPEQRILEKVSELFERGEIVSRTFPSILGLDTVKKMFEKAGLTILNLREVGDQKNEIEVYFIQPDATSQDKALEKSIKLHGLYETDHTHGANAKGLSLISLFEKVEERRANRAMKNKIQ
ncbi:MAG: hypothetical protein V4519_01220 [Patescibacteria group bacterium]